MELRPGLFQAKKILLNQREEEDGLQSLVAARRILIKNQFQFPWSLTYTLHFNLQLQTYTYYSTMVEITDKVLTENGADFTFVCGKVPFAISCSSNLPHRSCNIIDLDLVNKMKIPLKNIRVTRISIQSHDLRCVGVVSQTIQCVVDGKISGTIHLYAKVVRDLYSAISTDCLASRRTFSRLMGSDPPEEPPDNPNIEVLGGDEEDADDDDDDVRESNAEGEDVRESNAEGEDVQESNAEGEDVRESNAKGDDVRESIAKGDDVHDPVNYKDEDLTITKGIPSYCYSTTPFDEKSVYPDEWQDCYDSDGNFDPVVHNA